MTGPSGADVGVNPAEQPRLAPCARVVTPHRRPAPRPKSRQGCQTCVSRRKKCDEVQPVCGACLRLGLQCVRRKSVSCQAQSWQTTTHLLPRRPSPQNAVSNGYPAFRSDFEKNVTASSPGIFRNLLGRFADSQYRELGILATLCTENVMVREAIAAYSIITFSQRDSGTYATCIKAYQSCTSKLRQFWSLDTHDSACALVTTFFLGFLEALRLGGTRNALAHFRTCRAILVNRLKSSKWIESPLLSVYRIMAECIIFNVGLQSQFEQNRDVDDGHWGDFFECLIPTGHDSLSPFLGGFLDLYRIMFLVDQAARRQERRQCTSDHPDPAHTRTCQALTCRLNAVEVGVTDIYRSPLDCNANLRTEARLTLTGIALRINLLKLSRPAIQPSDGEVHVLVAQAMRYVRAKDICEPGYQAIRWPLTVLACAADSEDDFQAITEVMHEVAPRMDRAGGRKIAENATLLRHFRQTAVKQVACQEHEFCKTRPQGLWELLFNLRLLETA